MVKHHVFIKIAFVIKVTNFSTRQVLIPARYQLHHFPTRQIRLSYTVATTINRILLEQLELMIRTCLFVLFFLFTRSILFLEEVLNLGLKAALKLNLLGNLNSGFLLLKPGGTKF